MANEENMKCEEKVTDPKLIRRKKVGLILVLVVLFVLFISYSIYRSKKEQYQPTTVTRKYLKEKYKSEFTEITLLNERQYETSALTCDGSTFWPARKVDGKYEYFLSALSRSDGVRFDAYCVIGKDEKQVRDSYLLFANIDDCAQNFMNRVNEVLPGAVNYCKYDTKQTSLFRLGYRCDIDIYLYDSIEEKINREYINAVTILLEDANRMSSEFQDEYCSLEGSSIYFTIKLHFADNKYTLLQNSSLYVFNEGETWGVPMESLW